MPPILEEADAWQSLGSVVADILDHLVVEVM
jgi:hypothetical protein